MTRLHPNQLPPEDIIKAAGKVSDWFAERNITEWKLDGIERRADWISVKDRLPEFGASVLVARVGGGEPSEASLHRWADGRIDWIILREEGLPLDTFTHWMPLPEPPK